jgi:cbb3-type cytochrome oxidase cytochrome c subunit
LHSESQQKHFETMSTKIILAATILFFGFSVFATPPSEEGKTIFASRCAACHNVNKVLVGPALAGVDQRRSIDWIVNFVHSPQSVIKSGDQYAVDLFNKYKVQMPDHADLTADNIKSVVEYVKAESQAANEKAEVVTTEPVKTNYISMILANKGLLVSSLALVAILLAALWFVVKTKQARSKTY